MIKMVWAASLAQERFVREYAKFLEDDGLWTSAHPLQKPAIFSLFRKPKMSCLSLAQSLAPRFVRISTTLYIGETENWGELSWIAECVRNRSEVSSKQEWILFLLAGYLDGCRSSMTESDTHIAFLHSFLYLCATDLVEKGIFNSHSEFEDMRTARISEYLSAFTQGSSQKSNKMAVAKSFLVNAGCYSDDIAHLRAAGSDFAGESMLAKELFDDIKQTVRLTLE